MTQGRFALATAVALAATNPSTSSAPGTARYRVGIIDGGAFETMATVFNPDGSVVARARQLQLLALS